MSWRFHKPIKPPKKTFINEKSYIIKCLEYIESISKLIDRNSKLEEENIRLREMINDNICEKHSKISKLEDIIKQQNIEIQELKAIIKCKDSMKKYM